MGPDDEDRQVESAELISISNPHGWNKVSVAQKHVCAITTMGKLYCWGSQAEGRLGNGANFDRHPGDVAKLGRPIEIEPEMRWIDVDAKWGNTCVVSDDYRIWCWGPNQSGQLGSGDPDDDTRAIQPTLIEDEHLTELIDGPVLWTKVQTSRTQTCGLSIDGRMFCWGVQKDNDGKGILDSAAREVSVPEADTGDLQEWINMDVGDAATCGLLRDHSLWCWGSRNRSEVHYRPGYESLDETPTQIEGRWRSFLLDGNWTPASYGDTWYGILCAIPQSGSGVYCMGEASSLLFQESDPEDYEIWAAEMRAMELGHRWKSIASMGDGICGVLENNELACWGGNSMGELGDGGSGPDRYSIQAERWGESKPVKAASDWQHAAMGFHHQCAIDSEQNL